MLKNLLQLYALLVCLLTVSIMIVSVSLSLNYVTNWLVPEYKYYSRFSKYDSNEEFLHSSVLTKEKRVLLSALSHEDLTAYRHKEKERELKEVTVNNQVDCVSAFLWFSVAFVFFYLHWRLYKKSAHV